MDTAPPTAADTFSLSEPQGTTRPPRTLRRGLRFHGDKSKQLDAIHGSPDASVPQDHVVRGVIEYVGKLDLTAMRNKHSSLGRKPIDPRFKLQVWLYASLLGMHYAAQVARALVTDAALRLAAGGHSMSETSLKEFRRENGAAFEGLMKQILSLGVAQGLVDPTDLATDSMRLRADASLASMRTRARSEARLDELAKVDVTALSDDARAVHDAKVAKHEEAVARCDKEGRTGHSVTDPQAALMKFPSGASLPGHRVTVTSSGVAERFIVSVLVDGAPTDFGKLGPAVLAARDALIGAGIPVRDGAPPMQVAADAGYMSEADLRFAVEQRAAGRIDVVLPQPQLPVRTNKATGERYFGRDEFTFDDNGEVVCPAGRVMSGPYKVGEGQQWRGRGCADCPLRQACTPGKQRTLNVNSTTDQLHEAVAARLAMPGGKERYNRRIATIEPVFSYIEDGMHFTRSSSRLTRTVYAEVLLKALAYNISRLVAAAKGGRSLRALRLELALTRHGVTIVAVWLPSGDETERKTPAAREELDSASTATASGQETPIRDRSGHRELGADTQLPPNL
jgi:transposase